MGNHKFRLSNIIPNGWFYKLKEMGVTPKSSPIPTLPTTIIDEDAVQASIIGRNSPPLPRKSYHFSRKRSPITKKTTNSTPTLSSTTAKSSSSSSVSAACSCRSTATATVQSAIRSKPSSSPLQESASTLHSFDQMVAWSSTSCHCSSNSHVPYDDDDDVVIGVDKISLHCKTDENEESRIGHPPIRTEHKKFSDLVREIGEAEEQLLLVDKPIKHRKSSVKYRQDHVIIRSPVRRIPSDYGSPRLRLRINSPKLSRRLENGAGRKSASRSSRRKKRIATESMAVVKSSSDPERDFRESMMEMIVENKIREAKELEELLACYLSLNSMEYHHLIVHVFQQIWFDLNHITL